jgi:hypothetical protein
MKNIPIPNIKVENRLRPLNAEKVAELAESIAQVGLLQPIGVRPDGTLVYGYHRLEACKQLGWTEIPAVVVDGDDLHAELAEISENLIRNELTLLERAEHLARMRAVYEQLYPNARGVGDPRKIAQPLRHFRSGRRRRRGWHSARFSTMCSWRNRLRPKCGTRYGARRLPTTEPS